MSGIIAELSLDDIQKVCAEHGIPMCEFDKYFGESDVPEIAQRMADDYFDQFYWDSLWNIVQYYINRSEGG
jgi:hypothetical protein